MQHLLELPDPLVGRYLASEGLLEPATRLLSESALYLDYCVRLELAWLRVLAARGKFSPSLVDEAEKAARQMTVQEVAEEEQRVRHDLKALVNVLTRYCPEPVKPYVHLGATSYDILANAHLLRLREGTREIVLPLLKNVARELARLAREHAATPQIGRTHGQHAEPLTFGHAMAVYLERLGFCIVSLERSLGELRGKFSGAVGAYCSVGLLFGDARAIEAEVLTSVGLEPAANSTQIAHPEPALAVLHHCVAAFGVLANLADDLRHLQRTELGEVAEAYRAESQVGSSAMPHKRNPITWENVKSLWKTFMPQIMTFYMDQISEHQRDLTNSASARFLPRLLLGLAVAASRSLRGLKGLYVDAEQMRQNLHSSGQIISGPAQTLFSWLGVPDAHEKMRQLSVAAREQGRSLLELIQEDQTLKGFLSELSEDQRAALQDPERLARHAESAAREVADRWEKSLAHRGPEGREP